MRNYQLVLVLKTSLKEADRKKVLTEVKDFLKGSKFTKEEDWGEKPLSYMIKRETSGFFVNYVFELKEAMEKDFEKRLVNNENILRHLLLKAK